MDDLLRDLEEQSKRLRAGGGGGDQQGAMRWRITFNPRVHDRALELHAEAVSFGQDEAFEAALEYLIDRAQTDPLALGEVLYHLTGGESRSKAVRRVVDHVRHLRGPCARVDHPHRPAGLPAGKYHRPPEPTP